MMREGTGLAVPPIWHLPLVRGDVDLLRFHAVKRDSHRRYGERPDKWGRGLTNNPIFVGLCGEQALCVFLNRRAGCNCQLDVALHHWGDGGRDVVTDGLAFDVKTRAKHRNVNYVRGVDEGGRRCRITADFFVFAELNSGDQLFSVSLLGCLPASAVVQSPLKRSPVAAHMNFEALDVALDPMTRIVDEILRRRLQ